MWLRSSYKKYQILMEMMLLILHSLVLSTQFLVPFSFLFHDVGVSQTTQQKYFQLFFGDFLGVFLVLFMKLTKNQIFSWELQIGLVGRLDFLEGKCTDLVKLLFQNSQTLLEIQHRLKEYSHNDACFSSWWSKWRWSSTIFNIFLTHFLTAFQQGSNVLFILDIFSYE